MDLHAEYRRGVRNAALWDRSARLPWRWLRRLARNVLRLRAPETWAYWSFGAFEQLRTRTDGWPAARLLHTYAGHIAEGGRLPDISVPADLRVTSAYERLLPDVDWLREVGGFAPFLPCRACYRRAAFSGFFFCSLACAAKWEGLTMLVLHDLRSRAR